MNTAEEQEYKMHPAHVGLAIASVIQALLNTLKTKRVESLGGWAETIKKQGMVDMSDETYKEISSVEERFFHVIADLEKMSRKLPVKVVLDKKGAPIQTVDKDTSTHIYELVATMVDELDRFIDALVHGANHGGTYLDGFHDAIDKMEYLMLERSCTRIGSIATLRDAYKRTDVNTCME